MTTKTEEVDRPELDPAESPFMTVAQLARRWSRHVQTIRSWAKEGSIPSRRHGRDWMIPTAWVIAQEADDSTDPAA